jgi:hypothetical protein
MSNDANKWLLSHAANKYSQFGEDGILEKILEVLGEPVGWCVEFGAWDGRHLSNTCALIEDKGFSAILIEGSDEKFADLEESFKENRKVTPINAFVGFGAEDGLDQILAKTSIPADFDVLSIDIDGNDYHVWNAVKVYDPRVVIIEYNPTIPTEVEFIQAADLSLNHGSSIASIVELGRRKGYELICITDRNCIFVKDKHFARFGILNNSPRALRPDESLVTWIFCGPDGTVFLRGNCVLPWHGIPYREEKVQRVARLFRVFPSNERGLMRFLGRQYRSLKKRRWL